MVCNDSVIVTTVFITIIACVGVRALSRYIAFRIKEFKKDILWEAFNFTNTLEKEVNNMHKHIYEIYDLLNKKESQSEDVK